MSRHHHRERGSKTHSAISSAAFDTAPSNAASQTLHSRTSFASAKPAVRRKARTTILAPLFPPSMSSAFTSAAHTNRFSSRARTWSQVRRGMSLAVSKEAEVLLLMS